MVINGRQPLVSFTFDDFPESALRLGGTILNNFGVAGTYYVSLGLAGQEIASGRMFVLDHVKAVVEQGHELGCHTFAHCDSWKTPSQVFGQSIEDNRTALEAILPGGRFETLSYPISLPRPLTKRRAGRQFRCCRGGGQTYNAGAADLNQLSAFFLEKSRNNIEAVKHMIDRACEARGWLIFATHDVADAPTPYGCTPAFFEDVVRYAVRSGACVLPVVRALEYLELSGERTETSRASAKNKLA
jgi:peptidoglycan/xylan/chitin deacetylase (PgdA/CDA1 family)